MFQGFRIGKQELFEACCSMISSLSRAFRLTARNKRIILVARYDDYSSVSPTELERQILEAFRDFDVPVTFGVIPYVQPDHRNRQGAKTRDNCPLDEDKAAIVREAMAAGVLDIGLHGYSHEALAKSEFSGVEGDVQQSRLADGKKKLAEMLDVDVKTFVPPWNSYDTNTLAALENLGFECISADQSGECGSGSSLKFLPTTKQRLADLKKAVLIARAVADDEPIVVLVFHDYDFAPVGGSNISDLRELLEWVVRQKDVVPMSISQTVQNVADLSAERLVANRLHHAGLSIVPGVFYPRSAYLSIKGARLLRSLSYVIGFSIQAALAMTTLVVLSVFHNVVSGRGGSSVSGIIPLTVLVLFATLAALKLKLSFKRLSVASVALGVIVWTITLILGHAA